jgi:hypothetical protein
MDLSLKALEEAVGIRRQIERLEKRLGALFATANANASTRKPRRRMSAAGRARIAAAQRARWAQRRSSRDGSAAAVPKKRKRGLTPAGRRKLSQMMKARWAARRKANSRK